VKLLIKDDGCRDLIGFGVPPLLTTTAAMQPLDFRNGRLFFEKAR
jgi:hypothetical protein